MFINAILLDGNFSKNISQIIYNKANNVSKELRRELKVFI